MRIIHHAFTNPTPKPTPVAIQSATAGLADHSWWANPKLSWDEFSALSKPAAERMKESKLGRVNTMAAPE